MNVIELHFIQQFVVSLLGKTNAVGKIDRIYTFLVSLSLDIRWNRDGGTCDYELRNVTYELKIHKFSTAFGLMSYVKKQNV